MLCNRINEAEIFADLAAGNEKAFDVIYRHYSKRLFLYVRKLVKTPELAEELIQEIFVQIWMNRQVFSDVQYPVSYMYSIANRQALKYLKKVASDERILKSITNYSEFYRNETEEQVNLRESARTINQAVAELPAQRRLIWELSRNEGLSHDQIAERLSISRHTVKNQMVQALKHVRHYLDRRSGILTELIIIFLYISIL
ncbi:RNA polymerase sigma factor [Pararcticibacter amylolyticus]|uniref:RNA polymerase sigma-70 factor n=1 Tax=Pararcticibacter amylolyticus TaxID=2173175 RepID=A0A2U2PGQ8_9SPHI|nr:RNA polymerase sigma-70 factor [Pararcticibacter amylolyticus]PWG80598.1 RNA polymerase sigma-70 factor [Pararcticibacter amylolyticus]